MRKLIKSGMLLSLFCAVTSAHGSGREGGNGGDMCENRFHAIGDDIRSWIEKGGPSSLNLPEGVTVAQYSVGMLDAIARSRVSCVDEPVMISAAEKTCINFVDTDGTSRIVCNRDRFQNTPDSDQYVLVHHEYAGLAELEVNSGEESDYRISNQIAGFLGYEIVRKLVVSKTSSWLTLESLLGNYENAEKGCAFRIYEGPFENESDWVYFTVETPDGSSTVQYPKSEILEKIKSHNIARHFYNSDHKSIYFPKPMTYINRKSITIDLNDQGEPITGLINHGTFIIRAYGQRWCDNLVKIRE